MNFNDFFFKYFGFGYDEIIYNFNFLFQNMKSEWHLTQICLIFKNLKCQKLRKGNLLQRNFPQSSLIIPFLM